MNSEKKSGEKKESRKGWDKIIYTFYDEVKKGMEYPGN